MIHKRSENRRWQNRQKALRKQRISIEAYGFAWYPNLGSYDKGKIHCSCPRCAAKTGAALNRSNGPVDHSHSCRISCTNRRYGKKNYSIADTRRVDSMRDKEQEVFVCV